MSNKTPREARRAGLLSIVIATSGHFVWQMGTAYDDLIVSVLFLGTLVFAFPSGRPASNPRNRQLTKLDVLPSWV